MNVYLAILLFLLVVGIPAVGIAMVAWLIVSAGGEHRRNLLLAAGVGVVGGAALWGLLAAIDALA